MQTIARSSFTTVKTEGALPPADLLQRIADGRDVEGLWPEDYHLLPGKRFNEAINRAWSHYQDTRLSFDDQRRMFPAADTGNWQASGGNIYFWEQITGFFGQSRNIRANVLLNRSMVVEIEPDDRGNQHSSLRTRTELH